MSLRKSAGHIWKRGNWKPVPGLPGYEVSYSGRVRDVEGEVEPVLLKSSIGPCGFHTVYLARAARKHHQVGKLVALAWIGPNPDGATVRYLDGNLQNHNASNLAYGTRKEFYQDQTDRARREEAGGAPTHCQEGHRYSDLWFGGWGERLCRGCRRADPRIRPENLKYHYPPRVSFCIDCSAGIINTGPGLLAQRCPQHKAEAQREARRLRDRKRRESRPPKEPRISICIDCSVEVVNTGPGPVATRCPKHKAQARLEDLRRSNRKRRERVLLAEAQQTSHRNGAPNVR